MRKDEIIRRIKEANRFRGVDNCKMLKGSETKRELAALLTTAEGITFAKQTKFPTLDVLRDEAVKPVLSDNGIIVDRELDALNIPFLILAGKGHSRVSYDSNHRVYTLVVMHGYKVTVNATNGALVSLHNIDSEVNIKTSNYGKVIEL